MQLLLLTLVLFLAYILFYPALPFLFSFLFSEKDINKKVEVFLLTFGFPITFSILIFFETVSKTRWWDIAMIIILILATARRILFSKRKYLTKFNLGNENLDIEYLTPLLKTTILQLNTQDVQEFEILKPNWLVEYTASINIKYKQSWLTFELIDKKLKDSIKNQITATNK